MSCNYHIAGNFLLWFSHLIQKLARVICLGSYFYLMGKGKGKTERLKNKVISLNLDSVWINFLENLKLPVMVNVDY